MTGMSGWVRIVLLALLLAPVCCAQDGRRRDEPNRFHLERLHEWGASKTFVWTVSTVYTVDEDGRRNEYRSTTSLVIARSGQRTIVTGDGFGLSPIGTRREGLNLVSEKGWVLDASERMTRVAALWPVAGSILSSINPCSYEGYVFPPASFFYGYFAGTNPLTWLDTEWTEVESDARRWVFRPQFHTPLNAVLYPEVNARLTLSKNHNGSPLALDLDYGGIARKYRTIKFMKYQGYWVPSVVVFSENASSGWMRHESVLRLVEVKDTGTLNIQLPPRYQVNDFRLVASRLNYQECIQAMNERKNVIYFWDGHVPDTAELMRLAFMQGKLPPTRRIVRFSWWLVAPGALLILWGIFTYWRRRRRV